MRARINWVNGLTFLLGAALMFNGIRSGSVLVCTLGSLLACTGVGMAYDQGWARWLALAGLSSVVAAGTAHMVAAGFSARRGFGLIGVLWIIWSVVREIMRRRELQNRPLISLVQLRRVANNFLTDRKLAEVASRVWGCEFGSGSGGEQQAYVVGRSPAFIVNAPGMTLLINNFKAAYMSDIEQVASEMKELRMRHAIESHTAWLSVDLMVMHEQTRDSAEAYPFIAKIFADLLDDDCVAVYAPETGQLIPYDSELPEKLRGSNPLGIFGAPPRAPVIEVDEKNPLMIAAVQEARQRWPEFVAAFNDRTGDDFSIKAPVSVDGHTEFIWIELDRIEGKTLHGKLANDPVELGTMKCGDPVAVTADVLNDWFYLRNGEMVGGFTAKVLADLAHQQVHLAQGR